MFGWKWLNRSVSRKLISTYVIVVFLPIVVIVAIGDALYRSQLESNLQQTTYLAFRQLTLNMRNYFELVDDAVDQAFRDRELHEPLKSLKDTGAIDTLEDIDHMMKVNERLDRLSEQFDTRVVVS